MFSKVSKILSLALICSTVLCNASSSSCYHEDRWGHLESGNKKFVHSDKYAKQRKGLVNGQNPRTLILSCADSRVPPEIIFSQGLGDMFTCRVAGNVADPVVIDSLEYAVTHFDSNVLIVMGHSNCGAVDGAIKHLIRNGGTVDPIVPGHLNAVLIPIEMAILAAGIDFYASDALPKSIKANVSYQANQLISQSPLIADAISSGQLVLIGAEYELRSGKVHKLFEINNL